MGELMKNTFFKNTVFALSCLVALAACNGKTGPMGPQGPAGTGGKIVAAMNCSGYITGSIAALNGLRVDYDAVLTSAGDLYSTASVSDEYAQVSGTAFYAAGQSGANNGKVEIVSDHHGSYDAATWSISLNRNTLVTTAVYDDPSVGAPITLNFLPAACSVSYW